MEPVVSLPFIMINVIRIGNPIGRAVECVADAVAVLQAAVAVDVRLFRQGHAGIVEELGTGGVRQSDPHAQVGIRLNPRVIRTDTEQIVATGVGRPVGLVMIAKTVADA